MKNKTLSIIIPVYNEKDTLLELLGRVEKVSLPVNKQIIIIDDCSTDGTRKILRKIRGHKVFFHEKNKGKGAAIRTGLKYSTGGIIIIQDADLEYNPEQIPMLIQPIIEGKIRVVYGSRELRPHNHSCYRYFLGNKLLTIMTNLLFRSKITDMETCYKAFTKEVIKNINFKANRFDFEPEITAKILKRKEKILELPIEYKPRKLEAGKKISWKDGVYALWILIKYRFAD